MEEREVILKTDESGGVIARTTFPTADIEFAVDQLYDESDEIDELDVDTIAFRLEKLGYLKVVGPSPEIIELL